MNENWPYEDPADTLVRLRKDVDTLYGDLPAFRRKIEEAVTPEQIRAVLNDAVVPMFVRAVVLEMALQYAQARLRNSHE